MTQTITDQRRPNELRPHPLNKEIYADCADTDLIESIMTKGILTPLLITQDNLIISGHRRWDAAIKAGLEYVPVIVSGIEDPLEIEECLIESNRQRVKTNEQLGREYGRLKDIYNRKFSRQGQRLASEIKGKESLRPTHRLAADLGISKATAHRLETVVNHIDHLLADGQTEIANQLRQLLNSNVHAAFITTKDDIESPLMINPPFPKDEKSAEHKRNVQIVQEAIDRAVWSIQSIDNLISDSQDFARPLAEAISTLVSFHSKHFRRRDTRFKNLLADNNAKLNDDNRLLREEIASLKRALDAKRIAEPKLPNVMVEHSL